MISGATKKQFGVTGESKWLDYVLIIFDNDMELFEQWW